MFSRGHGTSRGQNKPKKETGSKKHHIRNWANSRKKKKETNLFASVMMSGDSSPQAQASISSTGFDVLDDARLGKITPTTSTKQPKHHIDTDAEAIEEAVPIVQTTLPVPESKPKLERNGLDMDTKKSINQPEDDSCIVNCIYFTQQCCECTIV